MDKSKNKYSTLVDGIKNLSKWARRSTFIIIAAIIIGFSNAFNDESKSLYDIKNFDQQEQLIDDDIDD